MLALDFTTPILCAVAAVAYSWRSLTFWQLLPEFLHAAGKLDFPLICTANILRNLLLQCMDLGVGGCQLKTGRNEDRMYEKQLTHCWVN